MKNFQIILDNSDGPDDVVWVRSDLALEDIAELTGKMVTPLPEHFTTEDGIDGNFPDDFQHLIL